ncbi:NrfD/PsrC family molybdoenzyme membrane anchor subunit [Halostagnicola sp. A-GB9-2]|uniref:NrfD/PsrC family molybdoenzyme membrane anchor subunit n=1 Tax=Halostagnicola sp. A-GB9-2 TaxID=3048066 RepID=UPI0024BF85F0|nr:NrfD/PsrC family molybdoenzyme membrane anchor subunit [Halostagnicola sp. A-GB9-2]MDJ1430780.1 polysulfide reductase NrfD [Halostagnicola sp. A-GB9-2]
MVLEITFDVPYSQWNWQVAVYTALIGLAAGAYLTGYVADLISWQRDAREHGPIAKFGYLIGLVGIGLGGPILLSHLATPFRAMLIPLTMTNFDSWMTIGAYMLGGMGLGAFLMFAWTAFGRTRPHRRTTDEDGPGGVAADGGSDVATDGGSSEGGPAKAATGGDTADGVGTAEERNGVLSQLDAIADYTRPTEPVRLAIGGVFAIFAAGVLLYSAMAFGSGSFERVALWDKTFLIPVMLFSGLGAGLTASVGLAAITENPTNQTIQNYSLIGSGFLVAALGALAATIFLLPEQLPAAEPAIDNMLGTYAWLFIGLAVVAGIVVPVLLSIGAVLGQRRDALSPNAATASYAIAGFLVIVGKIALSMSYLLAAEFTPLPLPV